MGNKQSSFEMADKLTLSKDRSFMKSIAVANVIDHCYEREALKFLIVTTTDSYTFEKEAFMEKLERSFMYNIIVLRSETDEELQEYMEEVWMTYTGENTEGLGPASLPPLVDAGVKAPTKPLVQEPETKKCVLCNSVLETYGNNPAPLAQDGECCDDCNSTKVIPARVAWIKADHEKRVAEFNARNA